MLASLEASEPKSGRLFKFGHGIFGPKWTEKWVHLDGTVLKYFSMAAEQSTLFSLSSARQSSAIDLNSYTFLTQEDKRINRKHTFHLIPKTKTLKPYVFACSSEQELVEWQEAFKARFTKGGDASLSPLVVEKLRRASESFALFDPRRTDKIDATKLRALLQSISYSTSYVPSFEPRQIAPSCCWHGDVGDFSIIQQHLDPDVTGKVTRTRFLAVLRDYFASVHQEDRVCEEPKSKYQLTTRHSFTDVSKVCQTEDHPEHGASNNSAHESSDAPDANPAIDEYSLESYGSSSSVREEFENIQVDLGHIPDWRSLYDDMSCRDGTTFERGFQYSDRAKQFRVAAENATFKALANIALDLPGSSRTMSQVNSALPIKLDIDGLWVFLASRQAGDDTESTCALHKQFGHLNRVARFLDLNAVGINDGGVCLQAVVDCVGFRALVTAPAPSRDADNDYAHSLVAPNGDDLAPCPFANVCRFSRGNHHDWKLDVRCLATIAPQDMCEYGSSGDNNEVFTRRFRPELIQDFRQSRSEGFGTSLSIRELQGHLHSSVIPRFLNALESGELSVHDSRTFTQAMHREGINARHLGLCFELASMKHIRRLLLTEMAARICKFELRRSLRLFLADKADEIKAVLDDTLASGPSEPSLIHELFRSTADEHNRKVVVEFFNLILSSSSHESRVFWNELVIPRVIEKFAIFQSTTIPKSLDDLLHEELLHPPQVFHALQHHCGVQFHVEIPISFNSQVPLGASMLTSVFPITTLSIRTSAECEQLLDSADDFVERGELDLALETVKFHVSIVDVAPRDERHLSLDHLLSSAARMSLETGSEEDAWRFAELCVESSTCFHLSSATALVTKCYVGVIADRLSLAEVSAIFEEGLKMAEWHLGPLHPALFDLLMGMMEVEQLAGDHAAALNRFHNATVLIRDCFGKAHVLYADVRRRYGEALFASGRRQEAEVVLEEVIEALDHLLKLGPSKWDQTRLQEAIADSLFMLAGLQASASDANGLSTSYNTALRALSIRREFLGTDHPDAVASQLQLGGIAEELGESYRAIEFFRPALAHLKTGVVDHVAIEHIKLVTKALARLHLKSVQSDKQLILAKASRQFASLLSEPSPKTRGSPDETCEIVNKSEMGVEEQKRLLPFVLVQLLKRDPIEYIDELIENANLEFQAQRRQSFTASLRPITTTSLAAEAPIPHVTVPCAASASRFASFSVGQAMAPMQTESSDRVEALGIVDSTGAYTASGQLAMLLVAVNSE